MNQALEIRKFLVSNRERKKRRPVSTRSCAPSSETFFIKVQEIFVKVMCLYGRFVQCYCSTTL